RDRVGITRPRLNDPDAVDAPTLVTRIPPILQLDPITARHVGPRRNAPPLLRHDRVEHAQRERARWRIEDLAVQQLPEDRRHRPSCRDARAPRPRGLWN